MEMFLSGSLVTGTGPARAATPGCRGAPPCWSLIRTGDAVSPRQLKTVKFQQPKHLHQARRMTISHPAPVSNLSNLQTLGGEEDRGDLQLPGLSVVVKLFLSTFLLVLSLSTKTNRGLLAANTNKIPSDGHRATN